MQQPAVAAKVAANIPAPTAVVPASPQAAPIAGVAANTDISQLLNTLILDAFKMEASDVHIEPRKEYVLVRYRVDGILRDIKKIDKSLEKSLTFKIKIAAKIRTDEHFAPQDGRMHFEFDGKTVDTRVSVLPTSKGEKIVMRLLTSEGKSLKLEDLGIIGRDLEVVTKSYLKPHGMIIAVGPTGSGKTTTLYTILKLINSRDVNITTVEDPVEYEIEGINHVHINPKAELTFAAGLRAILRQDPDIIMVGEIRDGETARIATNAALTGHLVLSSLHTNDAASSIPRLIDMGIEEFLVASTLNVIIAQRLGRKLCQTCKQQYQLTQVEYDQIKLLRPDIAQLIKVGETYFKEKGCAKCSNTGFKGRIGFYEILQVTEAVRRIITDDANADDIFHTARKQGMKLILEDGYEKLRLGITSLSELNRTTAIKE